MREVKKDIDESLTFSTTLSTAPATTEKASGDNITLVVEEHFEVDGAELEERVATYTIKKIGKTYQAEKVKGGKYY